MENAIPALLENNPGFTIAASFFALLGLAIKILKGAADFHYDYFTRRHLRRITELLPLVEPGSLQHDFLKQTVDGEVFKIAAGLKTSNRHAAALMHLCKLRLISPNQTKLFAHHIEPRTDGKVVLTLSKLDKIGAIYAVVAASVILLFGLYALAVSFTIDAEFGWIAGAVMLLICSFAARPLLSDFHGYRTVKRVRDHMLAAPLPLCEDCQHVGMAVTGQCSANTQAETNTPACS